MTSTKHTPLRHSISHSIIPLTTRLWAQQPQRTCICRVDLSRRDLLRPHRRLLRGQSHINYDISCQYNIALCCFSCVKCGDDAAPHSRSRSIVIGHFSSLSLYTTHSLLHHNPIYMNMLFIYISV